MKPFYLVWFGPRRTNAKLLISVVTSDSNCTTTHFSLSLSLLPPTNFGEFLHVRRGICQSKQERDPGRGRYLAALKLVTVRQLAEVARANIAWGGIVLSSISKLSHYHHRDVSLTRKCDWSDHAFRPIFRVKFSWTTWYGGRFTVLPQVLSDDVRWLRVEIGNVFLPLSFFSFGVRRRDEIISEGLEYPVP